MLGWFFYVLAAVMTWAFTAIVDKIFLTKQMNPFSYFLLSAPPKIAIVAWLFMTWQNSIGYYFWVSFIAGVLGVLGYYTYAFAVKREEISRVVGLASIYPLFVALLAFVLVNEVFTVQSYMGIVFVIAGVLLISYEKSKFQKFVPFIVIILAIATNIFYAVEQTISKISLNFENFLQFLGPYILGNLSTILPGLAIPQFRKSLREFRRVGRYSLFIIMCTYAFWMVGLVMFFYAASIGPITLVSTISTITPFLVFLFATTISIL